jgi:2-polyprenyl-3-methyl-5-hydroxy-6-metoxy-1,4-benzoquinol methylase
MRGINTMNTETNTEIINCPYCDESKSSPWASEYGFTAVKCFECGLVYVNPRPVQSLIREAVETGVHSNVEHGRTVIARRVGTKVARYKKLISIMFRDIWCSQKTISWLDVGAGYGELVEAITAIAPPGSIIEGIEPMKPKVENARGRGLKVREKFVSEIREKYDFVSIINIFSHIPDFRAFLKDLKNVIKTGGELLIETGNIGDLVHRREVPSELNLPDHLVFAGEKNVIGYLTEADFTIVSTRRMRRDGIINFAKNIVKKLIGRHVTLAIPYTSRYRSILIRAKLHSSPSAICVS